MTEESNQYKPGDIANGHILTADGRWVAIGAPPGPPMTQVNAQGWGQMQGSASPQQLVYVHATDSNNTSLAPVTSLVSGLIGLFVSWIPIVGMIAWILGPLAIVFGFLGLRRGKAEHKIMSWIGIVCGGLTIIICMIYAVVFVSVFGDNSLSSP